MNLSNNVERDTALDFDFQVTPHPFPKRPQPPRSPTQQPDPGGEEALAHRALVRRVKSAARAIAWQAHLRERDLLDIRPEQQIFSYIHSLLGAHPLRDDLLRSLHYARQVLIPSRNPAHEKVPPPVE